MSPVGMLESGRKNIVVLGAGFGGITALLKLHRGLRRRGLLSEYNLVLVNRDGRHLYTPLLYEIASIPRAIANALALRASILIPIENITAALPGVRFVAEEVVALDMRTHFITFSSGNRISFEYAIVALGAETDFLGIPGLAEYAYPIKTFADSLRLRNGIEAAAGASKGVVRLVIGGGGATGVELSSELAHCFRARRSGTGRALAMDITLVEAWPGILPGFSPWVQRRAAARLRALGVRLITGAAINRVNASEVQLADGRILPYDVLVWSGGVRPAATLRSLGLPQSPEGAILVNEFLEARPRIYAIGDNAHFVHPKSGKPLPGNVPVAEAEARTAAANIIADITRTRRRPFRPLKRYPFVLAVGGKYALTDLVVVKISGLIGWIAKQMIALRYLLTILPWPKAIRTWLRAVYYSSAND